MKWLAVTAEPAQHPPMNASSTLHHAPTCGGRRVEQSTQVIRTDKVAVTTWRCLDCAAFASQSRPLTEAEQLDADV